MKTAQDALRRAEEWKANQGKDQAALYAEAQEKQRLAEEAAAARKAEAERQKNLKLELQAAARKAAEEAARKEAEAAEAAKVEAARKAAEQARLNALGLADRIAEYESKLGEEGLSNADRYGYE